eukprot:Nitzschia sp. Nitz4//scaffold74_size92883//9269//10132//NITZ4_004809-RA/size92883-processed-gene-0.75-mRNA-1//-1//CDS//3329557553//3565//frame0
MNLSLLSTLWYTFLFSISLTLLTAQYACSFVFPLRIRPYRSNVLANPTSEYQVAPNQSPPSILIVNDQEAEQMSLPEFLSGQGFKVIPALDADSAYQYLCECNAYNTPNCVLSEISKSDELELLRRVRQDDQLAHIPFIVLSSQSMAKDRIAGFKAGADAYLPTPVELDELLVIVQTLIERHEAHAAPHVPLEDLKRDMGNIQRMLQEGGAGPTHGWVRKTHVFFPPDERRVLELLCQGATYQEIAERMGYSKRRVQQLVTHMFQKTKVSNRVQLVRWAFATGNVVL